MEFYLKMNGGISCFLLIYPKHYKLKLNNEQRKIPSPATIDVLPAIRKAVGPDVSRTLFHFWMFKHLS